jgi:para-aminobenzoate synthetase
MAGARQTEAPPVSAGPELLVERLDVLYDAERAFASLYGASPNAFWLDSSAVGKRGRFSFMGDSEGPLGAVVLYNVTAGQVRVERGGAVEVFDESIFDYLARELWRLRRLSVELPFDFDCGFAGCLGYELKADCDGDPAHRAATPDAAFVFADRLIAFDHQQRHTYLLSLVELEPELHQLLPLAGREVDAARSVTEAERWIEETSRRLAALPSLRELDADGEGPVELRLARPRDRYLEDIAACKRHLEAGHSYEICLTDKIVADFAPEPLGLYRQLRRANPAPFAAFLRFGDLTVLSSSPERFLRIGRDGWVEARPIKGTAGRGATPAEDARLAGRLQADEKSRAENVTIVDLMRNDLGRVCEFGTVEVPELMRVETYETVHQLVSSVRGRLREGLGPLDCIRACFPPGSMTGAPKVRTMEIIDELEGEARGAYSGAIGFLGLSGGCDLGVTIRTIVIDGDSATIGAGGAIVMESDPEGELEEMLLKARAPIAAIDPGATVSFPSAAGPRPQPDSAPDPIEQEPWP